MVFIIKPTIEAVDMIANQVANWKNSGHDIHILFVPRRTIECDEKLVQYDLFSEDKISQINMDLIPLEDDLLSLELNGNFANHLL